VIPCKISSRKPSFTTALKNGFSFRGAHDPLFVSLQKTFLKPNKSTTFKNYSSYSLPGEESNGTVHGGIAVLVNNAIPHCQIQLNTSLQAIAVRATCNKTISVCSIYLSSSSKFISNEFDNLTAQLPPPSYCLGTLMPTVPYGAALKLISEER